ncbi:MAG: hypothetical protein LBB72_04585 [Spirochaetaceae bacterium]|jgi:hypothetical protein|nr:hypothetical protein [Spirochaetaceae bacterium]
MNEKQVFQYILVSFFFLFLAQFSGAQDGEGFLTISRTERRYIQRIAWVGDEYTLRYEIVVEKEESGGYRRARQVFTSESFIELALQPGNYRCRVIPHDFLDRPSEGSEWMAFVIPDIVEDKAPEPYIGKIEPEPEPEPESESEPEPKKTIKDYIPVDFYLSGAWMPISPIYGEIHDSYYWNNTTHFIVGLRLGIVSTTQRSINLGMEFTLSRSLLSLGSYEYEYEYEYDAGISYVETLGFNLLAQKWFPKRVTALNFRAGWGYMSLSENFSSYYYSDDVHEYIQSHFINLGFSFLLRPMKHFIMEAGIDYIHLLEWGSPGFLRPWFGIGLLF